MVLLVVVNMVTSPGGTSADAIDRAKYVRRAGFEAMLGYFRQHHPWQYPILCLAWPRWWMAHR